MDANEINKLWISDFPNDRIQAINEILKYPFIDIDEIPDFARKILAHAMYHDYRVYPDGDEIWIISLLASNELCEKYNWAFKNITLNEQEIELL